MNDIYYIQVNVYKMFIESKQLPALNDLTFADLSIDATQEAPATFQYGPLS